ncbi:hypothetical protein IWX48DRAFT_232755 [Phyllosticta citricarpa]
MTFLFSFLLLLFFIAPTIIRHDDCTLMDGVLLLFALHMPRPSSSSSSSSFLPSRAHTLRFSLYSTLLHTLPSYSSLAAVACWLLCSCFSGGLTGWLWLTLAGLVWRSVMMGRASMFRCNLSNVSQAIQLLLNHHHFSALFGWGIPCYLFLFGLPSIYLAGACSEVGVGGQADGRTDSLRSRCLQSSMMERLTGGRPSP